MDVDFKPPLSSTKPTQSLPRFPVSSVEGGAGGAKAWPCFGVTQLCVTLVGLKKEMARTVCELKNVRKLRRGCPPHPHGSDFCSVCTLWEQNCHQPGKVGTISEFV